MRAPPASLPQELVDIIWERVFTLPPSSLIPLRRVCRGVKRRVERLILSSGDAECMPFTAHARKSASKALLEARQWPDVFHASEAKRRTCAICGGAWRGGFEVFESPNKRHVMLIYAHRACTMSRCASTWYVNRRQYLLPPTSTRGANAVARLGHADPRTVPALRMRGVDRVASQLPSLPRSVRIAWSAHHCEQVDYEIVFVSEGVPWKHTLLGSLYETEEELSFVCDAEEAWKKEAVRVKDAKVEAKEGKRREVASRREAWLGRQGTSVQRLRDEGVIDLAPFDTFVGGAFRMQGPTRETVREALREVAEYVRIRDDLTKRLKVLDASDVRGVPVSKQGVSGMLRLAARRWEENEPAFKARRDALLGFMRQRIVLPRPPCTGYCSFCRRYCYGRRGICEPCTDELGPLWRYVPFAHFRAFLHTVPVRPPKHNSAPARNVLPLSEVVADAIAHTVGRDGE